jgi:DNA-binding SARP family transcriptional activator/class 3 adenylate cyclase
VVDVDRPLALGGPQQRALLAVLLVHRGESVSSDRLMDELWGEQAPASAIKIVQGYVSNLRKVLGDGRLITRGRGYSLHAEPGQLDVDRFESLVTEGRRALHERDPRTAAGRLREALALWRGPPFADFSYQSFAQSEIARLEESRLAALEERIDAELALGEHAQLVGELEALVREHASRERFIAQLMLALYRAGRQAEALAAYQHARVRLADELGLGPGPALRALEIQILEQAPGLQPGPLSDHDNQRVMAGGQGHGTSSLWRPPSPVRVLACQNCGEENPDGGRFCTSCGAMLVEASAGGVRKTVTIVFADIAGSTALGDGLDVESFRQVVRRFSDLARMCFERHSGAVQEFMGDAVVAVFGVPAVHEDDALRAVRAAGELRDLLGTLNVELDRDYQVSLDLRIGVNTGEVIADVSEIATGDVMHVAVQLEQAAVPGEILIGEQTLALARGAVEVERADASPLTGKAQPVVAHRLLRVVAGAPAFSRRLDTPLVGRRDEHAQIRSAFEDAVTGRRCQLLTAIGPPGIGKSRLARELALSLADDATVLTGRCLPYGDGIAYWPLVEIFREADAENELEQALAAGVTEEIFWSVRKALEHRARERPLALVLDDIHWAEPTLLDLIEHLADWTRDAPILLLCLARPELLSNRPAWRGRRIRLEPLRGAQCDELIAALIEDDAVDGQIRTRIHEVADGNPLFVEQLLAMLSDRDDLVEVPATMRALLAARLDALPEDERDVLERASVVGLEFEWEALAELAPGRRRPPGALLAALVRKEYIRPHESAEDTFRFEHILLRDAAYGRMRKSLRSDLHERFADWREGSGEEFDEIVGYHLEQAHRCLIEVSPADARAAELSERAAACLGTSGVRAYARGDMPAAARLLHRAVSLYPTDDPRRLRLLLALGRSLIELGETHEADSVLSQAVDRARATQQVAVRMDAGVTLATLRLYTDPQQKIGQGNVWSELDAAIPFFEQSGDRAALARALGVSGKLRFWRGEAAAAVRDLGRAASLARQAGELAQEVDILRTLLMALVFGPMPVAQAIARVEALQTTEQRSRPLRVHLLQTRAHLDAMQGSFVTAREHIAQAKELAEELGLELALARIAHHSAPIELLAGDAAAAEREFRTAYEALKRMGSWGDVASILPPLVDALLAQGRDEDALDLADLAAQKAIPEDIDVQVGWRRVRAKARARHGDLHQAQRLAREAVAIGDFTDYLDLRAQAWTDVADILDLANRPKESASALQEALRLREQKGNLVAAASLRKRLGVSPPSA